MFVGGDLNEHVGESNENYEDYHGGKGIGARNEPEQEILVLCKSYGLIVFNTIFIKHRRHLVTYDNEAQIDYHLVPSLVRRRVKDCKVILGESLALQHRLLVNDFFSGKAAPRRQTGLEKIKWHKLNNESGERFVAVMHGYLQDILNLDGDADDGDLEAHKMCNC